MIELVWSGLSEDHCEFILLAIRDDKLPKAPRCNKGWSRRCLGRGEHFYWSIVGDMHEIMNSGSGLLEPLRIL